jgi:biofilm PGA synthesis lipoprotein PgaB
MMAAPNGIWDVHWPFPGDIKMRRQKRFLLFCVVLLTFWTSPVIASDFLALCYHGVEDTIVNDSDGMEVSTNHLVAHLNWLLGHGWIGVSLKDIQEAQTGGAPLPEKAFLLTFDDGYSSAYRNVLPILEGLHVPAVFSLVASWLEPPAGAMVNYGGQQVPREKFLTWEQVREMQASGLVEIASHSADLHHGVLANPQGNEEPAVSSRIWFPEQQRYETETEWTERIEKDLRRSVAVIKENTGRSPQAIAWPYGEYSRPAIDIATKVGMPLTLTLDSVAQKTLDMSAIPRMLVANDPDAAAFAWQVRHRFDAKLRRVAHVDLDYVYDPDPDRQHQNLSRLLNRIKALGINTVFLQAYADPDGDGVASALYFKNRHLPMRADLFNRVAWQLRTRANVQVFAWLPVLAFAIDGLEPVAQFDPLSGAVGPDPNAPRRLSPFSQSNREAIGDIYEDLAVAANVAGILFSDDAYLSDFEDAGAAALEHYHQQWGLAKSIDEIRSHDSSISNWADLKTNELINLTNLLLERARKWRPQLESARNLFALPVQDPRSKEWFAQDLDSFAAAYDWVAVMAMPWMEEAADPQAWLETLIAQVKKQPKAFNKTIFELQTVDWAEGHRKIPTSDIAQQIELLLSKGVVNIGYYPDDFLKNHPHQDVLRELMSLSDIPYLR